MKKHKKETVLGILGGGSIAFSGAAFFFSFIVFFLKSEKYIALGLLILGLLLVVVSYLVFKFGFGMRNSFILVLCYQAIFIALFLGGITIAVGVELGFGLPLLVCAVVTFGYYVIVIHFFEKIAKYNDW